MPTTYRCKGGAEFSARFYNLSDDSLGFVKLTLPGNRQYTLPHGRSANGLRYSDERTLVLWEKNAVAWIHRLDAKGRYHLKYDACRELQRASRQIAPAETLRLTGGQPVEYVCDGGAKLAIRYYELTDNSLSIAKIGRPNGIEYTGSKVGPSTDEHYALVNLSGNSNEPWGAEWWLEGSKGRLDEFTPNTSEDGWAIKYRNCQPLKP